MSGLEHVDRTLLRQVDLFSECSDREIELVARVGERMRIQTGSLLARQGSRARRCTVIRSGEAVVVVDGTPVGSVGRGAVIGDLQLLSGDQCAATVVATSTIDAIVLRGEAMDRLLVDEPAITLILLRAALSRLRRVQLASGRVVC